jgi:ABC-type Zn uptake system ZnuABC Zn-binding protein ZnuA
MPLRPENAKQVLKIIVQLLGPQDPQKFKDFEKEFNDLVRKFGAKVVDTVKETRT